MSHDDIADKVVARLKDEHALRGCPLTREEQADIKDILVTQKKAKKWAGVLLTALIIVAAKDVYGFLITAWQAVTK